MDNMCFYCNRCLCILWICLQSKKISVGCYDRPTDIHLHSIECDYSDSMVTSMLRLAANSCWAMRWMSSAVISSTILQ